MIEYRDEITINAPQERAHYFLTHIDTLYKVWHPKDHVFCKTIRGTLKKEGCVLHFFEWVGRMPLYLMVNVKQQRDDFLKFDPVFPFSLLNIGYGTFSIKKLDGSKCILTAYVKIGYNTPVIGNLIDTLCNLLYKPELVKKHMKEEGQNLKKYVENNA